MRFYTGKKFLKIDDTTCHKHSEIKSEKHQQIQKAAKNNSSLPGLKSLFDLLDSGREPYL